MKMAWGAIIFLFLDLCLITQVCLYCENSLSSMLVYVIHR